MEICRPLTPHQYTISWYRPLVGKPEFYLREVRRHLDRAIACKSLGLDPQDPYDQAATWDRKATDRMQPIALARTAKLDPNNPNITAERRARSRAVLQAALSRSKDLMTLLHASSVLAVATGNDYTTKRHAWGILACEYEDCGTLDRLYRGKCEATVMNGTFDRAESASA